MFGALGRWLKALSYFLTGRMDKARETLDRDPNVIRSKFAVISAKQRDQIGEMMRALAGTVGLQEDKKSLLEERTKDHEQLIRRKTSAIALAKDVTKKLQAAGKTVEQIQADPEYIKHDHSFRDFSSSLQQNEAEIVTLKADIEALQKQIESGKLRLMDLKREAEKTAEECNGTIADVISSQQIINLNKMLAGVSTDETTKMREDMRKLRTQIKAEASVSNTLAGTDVKDQMREYDTYIVDKTSSDEFAEAVGLKTAVAPATEQPAAAEPDATLAQQ